MTASNGRPHEGQKTAAVGSVSLALGAAHAGILACARDGDHALLSGPRTAPVPATDAQVIFGSVDRVVSRLLGDVDSVVVLPRTHEDAILAAAQEIDMQSRKP